MLVLGGETLSIYKAFDWTKICVVRDFILYLSKFRSTLACRWAQSNTHLDYKPQNSHFSVIVVFNSIKTLLKLVSVTHRHPLLCFISVLFYACCYPSKCSPFFSKRIHCAQCSSAVDFEMNKRKLFEMNKRKTMPIAFWSSFFFHLARTVTFLTVPHFICSESIVAHTGFCFVKVTGFCFLCQLRFPSRLASPGRIYSTLLIPQFFAQSSQVQSTQRWELNPPHPSQPDLMQSAHTYSQCWARYFKKVISYSY